ncbi:hypothetical protein UFOVP1247_110 [uncultured Caudovirales phage]|uniref:Uncharacterized protein n=1 Tax=uncultured Caudovirales phage TaxID=2100421 RepID=A0A6J5Q6X5_9CAUD|nr:hypothetical protein UFOVP970_150 [uncultured Caudovirales phage]CAB4193613.1 hypothetical protein UFOVP1247_110 [uncultured Caudovirales phage]
METLNEKWFTFRRIQCKEGFIDWWQGDQANDPNLDEKSYYNLNSTSTMFRLNGKDKWVHTSELVGLNIDIMQGYPELFSSDDLWYMAQIKTIHRATSYSKEECGSLLDEHDTVEAAISWFVENKKSK